MTVEEQKILLSERNAMQSALDDAERRATSAIQAAVGLSEFIGWMSDEKGIDIAVLNQEFLSWILEEE